MVLAAPLSDLLQRVVAAVPALQSSMTGVLQAAQVAGEGREGGRGDGSVGRWRRRRSAL